MATKSLHLLPPTGMLRADHVELLASSLEDGGRLELSADSGIRISVPDDAAARLLHGGLIERVPDSPAPRVLCSPLTGRIGGHLDVRALALRLEEQLRRATAAPAAQPGVVGVDDGSGDIDGLGLRLVFAALDRREFAVLVDGADSGDRVRHNGSGQHSADPMDSDAGPLAPWLEVISRRLPAGPPTQPSSAQIPIGWLDHSAGGLVTLGAAVADGELDGRQLQFLAALERPVVITPWRTLLLCDLDELAAEQVVRVLAPLGFVFDADSPVLSELGRGNS